eukprot:Gb_13997 [translate_table: standard]
MADLGMGLQQHQRRSQGVEDAAAHIQPREKSPQYEEKDGHDHKKKGVAGRVKDTLTSVKDAVTGQHKGTVAPPCDQEPRRPEGGEKVGCMEKIKDLVTGQKPGHGTASAAAAHVRSGESQVPSSGPMRLETPTGRQF